MSPSKVRQYVTYNASSIYRKWHFVNTKLCYLCSRFSSIYVGILQYHECSSKASGIADK